MKMKCRNCKNFKKIKDQAAIALSCKPIGNCFKKDTLFSVADSQPICRNFKRRVLQLKGLGYGDLLPG